MRGVIGKGGEKGGGCRREVVEVGVKCWGGGGGGGDRSPCLTMALWTLPEEQIPANKGVALGCW